MITSVAEGYLETILSGYKKRSDLVTAILPIGADRMDFDLIEAMDIKTLVPVAGKKLKLLYAGVLWDDALPVLDHFFKSLSTAKTELNFEFHFIGTGNTTLDQSIASLAGSYNILHKMIFEYPERISFVSAIANLNQVDGMFIFGSIRPYYTPSKLYLAIEAQKPVFAFIHRQSTAVSMISTLEIGVSATFDTKEGNIVEAESIIDKLNEFQDFALRYRSKKHKTLESGFSAKKITEQFAHHFENVVKDA